MPKRRCQVIQRRRMNIAACARRAQVHNLKQPGQRTAVGGAEPADAPSGQTAEVARARAVDGSNPSYNGKAATPMAASGTNQQRAAANKPVVALCGATAKGGLGNGQTTGRSGREQLCNKGAT